MSNKLYINESVFDTITEESAYWIGFLMADGNIHIQKKWQPKVSLVSAIKDVKHIQKFKDFLKSKHKISIYNNKRNKKYHPACKIQFLSKKIADSLLKYGITPKKSFTSKVRILENNRHFWRGMIDGDGCLSVCKRKDKEKIYCYPVISLSGSIYIIDQFITYVNNLIPRPINRFAEKNNIFKTQVFNKSAIKIIRELYDGATVYLDRKHEKAKSFIKEYG